MATFTGDIVVTPHAAVRDCSPLQQHCCFRRGTYMQLAGRRLRCRGRSAGPSQATSVKTRPASPKEQEQQPPQAAGGRTEVLIEARGRTRRRLDLSTGEVAVDTKRDAEGEMLTYGGNVTDFAKGFLLPRGYPDSVTDDYLAYQLWAFPCHVFGWLSHSLATSSLLKAVGVDPGAAGTAGATAAVKWITKDGIGALGRLLVGGRLGPVFDEDPKRWRMLSEALATAGMSLEIATAFAPPQAFLLLAGLGNFALAAGKGMGKPCFRIIQTHFATERNFGDVAAKEEVWEVGAQLLGLGGSILVLNAIQAGGNPYAVLWAWAACQAAHVGFRYGALASLRLTSLNHKRACFLVSAHVAGRPVPGPAEVGREEGRIIMLPPPLTSPRLALGCSLEELLAWAPRSDSPLGHSGPAAGESNSRSSGSPTAQLPALPAIGIGTGVNPAAAAALLHTYRDASYLLTWRGGAGRAMLREGAPPSAQLQALLQAAQLGNDGVTDASTAQLSASAAAAAEALPALLEAAAVAGWDVRDMPIRAGACRLVEG